jgi:hypothetical protein
MIPYLVRLLDITMNNISIPGDWKKDMVVPIYRGGDQSVIGKYRVASSTSVVCKQMEHVIAGYLMQIWEMIGYTRANMASDWGIHANVN